MKTKIKRHSRAVLSIVLTLCMIVSCMTVGIIATDAAKTADERVGAVDDSESVGAITQISLRGTFNNWSSTEHTATSSPASWDISLTANTEYQFKVVFVENGEHYCGITQNNDGTYNVSDLGNEKQLYWGQGGNVHFTPTTTGTYTFKVTSRSNNNYITITKKAETTYPVSVTAGTGGKVASASVDAGATPVKLPKATPKPGYDFNNWTATSPATISSGAASADNGYVKATGTGGSVTANFTPKANMYLSGWINGSAKNVADAEYKFTKNSDTNYTKSFTATGACYVTLNDGTTVYHPSSNNSPSGSEVDPSKTSGYNDDPKWFINVSDGDTVTVTWNPSTQELSWTTADHGQGKTVKVYAKDGTIRRKDNNYSNHDRNNIDYSTFEKHANTYIYSDSGYTTHIGTRSSNDGQSSEGSTNFNGYTYDYIASFDKGQTLYIKTNLKNDTYMNRYYLYAYSINGKCYQIHTVAESEAGYVTEAFTVPEDWEYGYVEITPIYFLRDSLNEITFYVEGYDEEVMKAGWGNTPYVYPFYQDANYNNVTNVNNPFGGYQGQPLVFYKGNYYTQLPKTFEAIPESGGTATNCTIRGVTLGNGYWDDIHYLTKEVKSHFQTYDYDDLYKIVTEYPTQADHIICSFKYRTKKNNDEPGNNPNFSNYNKTNGNGWEVLTDYYGRPVDIFGTVLTGTAQTTAENIIANGTADSATGVVHAISQDYKSNSAGSYGTEWAIYNTAGTKVVATSGGKTTIVPSALAIKATTTGTDVAAGLDKYGSATKSFKSIYTALYNDSAVRGQPVVITYEKSIYGGGEKADRCDARWYFSTTGQPISATTRIEYTDDGKNWVTDTYNANTGTGSHTGTKAYFTGKASTAKDTPDSGSTISGKDTTTISGTTGGGYYTFNAENHNGTNGNYEFVGWYLLRDNYQNISTRSSYDASATTFASHAEQSKNGDIFVARFKKTATGTLDIFHEVHPQASGCGHVYVEAIVQDAGGTQQGSKIGSISDGTLTSHITIPNTYIRSGEGYKVIATFKAAPYPTSNFDNFYATVNELLSEYDGYGFVDSVTFDTTNNTATVTYDVNSMFSVASGSPVQTVTSVTHYSKFSLRDDLTYNLEYRFTTRYYGDKLYKYTNQAFTAEELRSYFRSQIEDPNVSTIEIDKQFVARKAPFESNYREDLTWVIDNVEIVNNVGKLTATQVPIEWANAMVYDFDNNGNMVTQQMAAPLDKLFDKTVTSVPTSGAAEAIENWNTNCTDDKLYTALRTSYTNGSETVPLYLHHWEAYRLDSFTYYTNSDGTPKMKDDGYNLDIDTGKSTLVCKSYSTKFNYVGYEDYAIVPVYTTTQMSTPERQAESDRRTDSSATLLTITRNHWNTTVNGTADSGTYGEANKNYDRLYVDMMLNYNYSKDGTNVRLSTTGDNIKVGFIVKSYTIDYSSGTGVKDYTGRSSKVYVLTNAEKRMIDNKNRIEYCYGFANSQINSQYGLNFEFIPFIVDTNDQEHSEGSDITINNQTYKTLYADSTVSILDGVNFYMIGKSDTTWDQ